MSLVSHQLLRCAKPGHLVAEVIARIGQPPRDSRIRDVAAIPSKQEVHAVDGRDRYVGSVLGSFRGKQPGLDRMRRQGLYFRVQLHHADSHSATLIPAWRRISVAREPWMSLPLCGLGMRTLSAPLAMN